MSEENKDFEDKAKDAIDNAKETAKETFEDAKEATKDFVEDAKETAKDFSDNVTETINNGENKKVLAGLLAIFIGSLGIHKFILGYNKEGVIQILLSFLCGIGGIIGIIEGIIYLTKSDEEFYNTYQVGKKGWF